MRTISANEGSRSTARRNGAGHTKTVSESTRVKARMPARLHSRPPEPSLNTSESRWSAADRLLESRTSCRGTARELDSKSESTALHPGSARRAFTERSARSRAIPAS